MRVLMTREEARRSGKRVLAVDGTLATVDAETKHDPSNGQFTGGGGSNTSSKPNTTRSEVIKKIQGASKAALMNAFNNPGTDPKVKNLIEKELDDRANRGI